jgi:hypothetical protein
MDALSLSRQTLGGVKIREGVVASLAPFAFGPVVLIHTQNFQLLKKGKRPRD